MARDALDDVICIKIPVLVTMVAVLIVLRLRQRRRTLFDTQPEGLDNMESDPLDDNDHQEYPRSSSSSCNSRPPRALRTSTEDAIMTDIAQAIGQIASSLKRLKKKNWKEKLTDALDSLQGYSVEDMELLYVTLRGNRRLAKDFYMRKQILRINFVEQFLAERRASRP